MVHQVLTLEKSRFDPDCPHHMGSTRRLRFRTQHVDIHVMPYKDRDLQRAAQHAHYKKNKDVFIERTKQRRNVARRLVLAIKTAAVCTDCRINYPHYVLQFDHVRGVKRKNVCELARDASIETVEAEIAKCEVVCGNCHAERTWRRATKTA